MSDEKEARDRHWLQREAYSYCQLSSKILGGANLGETEGGDGAMLSMLFYPRQG